MYVIIEGSVSVHDGSLLAQASMLSEGDFFLAETLSTRASPAPATYTSNGGVTAVVIDRTLLRQLVEFRGEADGAAVQATVELHELHVLATLGVGGFGRVKMVVHPNGIECNLLCIPIHNWGYIWTIYSAR